MKSDKFMISDPFEKKIPSVFAIASPLQVLCATAVINQLEISDYKIVVCYEEGDLRNSQMWSVLDYFGMHERVTMKISRFNLLKYKIRSLLHHNNQYKRLFIGDFHGYLDFILGCSFVSDNSKVVYLDDGTSTISLFNNVLPEPMRPDMARFLNKVSRKRNIEIHKNFLTIYKGLKNENYNSSELDLKLALANINKSAHKAKGIFIIGTNVSRYCEPLGVPEDIFVEGLDNLIGRLKVSFPNTPIVYIPHGRDASIYAINICNKYGCEFRRPQMMVELELLDQNLFPDQVYGFTSAALFNIKQMFPQSKVVNILFKGSDTNESYREYLMITNYYLQNGIELMGMDN